MDDPKPDAKLIVDIIEPLPRWIADTLSVFDRPDGEWVSGFHIDRVKQILGSLEYEPRGSVNVVTTLAKSHIGICFRVHPLEFDLVIPWLMKPQLIRREYGRAIDDSLIRNPNVRQLREALAWVDAGYLNRGED